MTASQLDQVFGFPASGPHAAFNDLDQQIGTVGETPPRQSTSATRAPGQPPAPPVVAIANGLIVQDGTPVTDRFLRILAAQYDTGARLVDYPSGQAVDQINTWVRTKTAERIKKLFDERDPSTRLVLANAVCGVAVTVQQGSDDRRPVHPRRRHDRGGADDAPAELAALCQRLGQVADPLVG